MLSFEEAKIMSLLYEIKQLNRGAGALCELNANKWKCLKVASFKIFAILICDKEFYHRLVMATSFP